MMLEIAIGDAYGAGFEYAPRGVVDKENNLSRYISHQKHKTVPGTYTDDTQMSIAIAELLTGGKDWTPLNIANRFVEVFKRDQRRGYASRFYDFLMEVRDGKEFLERIRPHSEKSGSAMRAGPIGFLPNKEDVIRYSITQARLTHNTPKGIKAAVAASLIPHYFLYNLGRKKDIAQFLTSYEEGNWDREWKGEVDAFGVSAVRAAITAIKRNDSLSGVLKDCIGFGGDVDTVAAIAMAGASCSSEIKQDLPNNLQVDLENGQFGRNYLIELDNRLKARFGK